MMEVIPITSGMADATIAPKIIRRRRNVNGIAIASAIFKSSWIRPLIAFAKTACPDM